MSSVFLTSAVTAAYTVVLPCRALLALLFRSSIFDLVSPRFAGRVNQRLLHPQSHPLPFPRIEHPSQRCLASAASTGRVERRSASSVFLFLTSAY